MTKEEKRKKKISDEPSYDELVESWYKRKNKMLDEKLENPVLRNVNLDPYKYFENSGKKITDTNPYINWVSIDEFDLMSENEPFRITPPVMERKSHDKEPGSMGVFGAMHKQVTGSPMTYLKDLGQSTKRLNDEVAGVNIPTPSFKKEKDLRKLKEMISSYANSLGFASVGVTKVDMRYVSDGMEHKIVYNTMILLGYEMSKETMERYPNPDQSLGAFSSYAGCARNVHHVADFIRSKGYDCRSMGWGGDIKYSPHAVNAGLGNYSTYGVCITPEVGSRLKYCAVLIDADLELDKPRDFNIEEFCSRCRMCQKSCPSGSIPKEETVVRGASKRQTRYTVCLELMSMDKECLKCVRVCPFSMIGFDKCMASLPSYYMYNLDLEKMVSRGE